MGRKKKNMYNGLMLPGKSSFLHLLTTTSLGSTLVYKKIMVVRHLILYFMLPPSAFQQHMDEPANSSLLRIGLLGCSPLQPTIAIRLECLELYHQIRRYQSSFSIQAFTKVLCTLHNSLDRDHEDWPMSGACPCCTFEQPNEPILIPRRLHCMDGNFSAKRLDGSGSSDLRVFRSYYFIPHADVEHFKDD
ncbi:hypothetical protein EV424DRAFT_1356046, partial [Suillus variegatus]